MSRVGTLFTDKSASANTGAARFGVAGGLAGWLLQRWGGSARPAPRMKLLERITLAPKQALSLIEADGRRFLIASSPEGAPAFYPLDEIKPTTARPPGLRNRMGRTAW